MNSLHVAKTEIVDRLTWIESEYNVRVLYACESGSRAWGFESPNSDYDVRFIYANTRDWYLSIGNHLAPDTIQPGFEHPLDFSGWDLRKALLLFQKGNPQLVEWLHSPIWYLRQGSAFDRLRRLAPTFCNKRAMLYHYLSMASDNYREFVADRSEVSLKRYFYIIRPFLVMRWLAEHDGVPPVPLREVLCAVTKPCDPLRREVGNLLLLKAEKGELGTGPRNAVLDHFIMENILDVSKTEYPVRPLPDVAPLNEAFRAILNEEIHAGETRERQPAQ